MDPEEASARLAAEQRARVLIDRQLTDAGWVVQSRTAPEPLRRLRASPSARWSWPPATAARTTCSMSTSRAVGVIEAKPEGTTLSGVEWQSAMYAEGLPADVRLKALTVDGRLPFVFEASGLGDPLHQRIRPRPRGHDGSSPSRRPATLARALRDAEADPDAPTWRGKVQHLPTLDVDGPAAGADHRDQRRRAQSLAEQRFDRSLVQMATGAGKTFTAVTASLPAAEARRVHRVLFLVDRNNLGRPDAGGVPELPHARTTGGGSPRSTTSTSSPAPACSRSSNVVISTIQRVHRALSGEEVADADDPGLDDFVPDAPVDRHLQPQTAAGDVRPGHRRRGAPVDLRRVARRAGVLRRAHRRPDRHPGQADVRLLPAEPRLGVHLPAVGRRRCQRRLRPLPDQHPDHRPGLADRGRHRRTQGRPAHPPCSGYEALDEDLGVHRQAARPGGHRRSRRSALVLGDLPRPAVHRDLPRPLRRCPRR
ncbi:MAG: DEAD/DEAH box helicase family protein [Nocardioidaceae bacterium]